MQEIKLFADCRPRLSESPIHRRADNMLYWRGLDGEVFRMGYDGTPDSFEVFRLNIGNIGSILEQEDFLLLFGDDGGVWKWLPGNEPTLLKRYPLSLFNDCIADSVGRVYCGVLAENYFDAATRGKTGKLVRIELDGSMTLLEELDHTTPNGIRFSPENDKLYFAVTDANCVFVYDYNESSGNISSKRIFADDCCPDGITVDSHGDLFVTDCRPKGPLIRYSKGGEIKEKYLFPVRRVTSVGFGNGDTLFVTTAHEGEPTGEHDGGVFMLEDIARHGAEYFVKVKW